MKKWISGFLMVALVAGLLTGCAPKAPSAEAPASPDSAPKITAKEAIKDLRVRKALTLAVDRTALVETVTKGGQIPAGAFIPPGLKTSDGKDFRDVAGDYGIDTMKANVEEAKKLLAEAGYPDGKGFPKLEIIYNTNEAHKAIAEAIQEMWKQNLNVESSIVNQEFAVFQDTRHQGNFQIARAGWTGDYADPMTFLDLWTTYSGNNDAHWYRKDFDALIEKSKMAQGKERDELLVKAEQMLMGDMPVMPLYYYTVPVQVKADVKGWTRTVLGQWFLAKATSPKGVVKMNLNGDPKTIDPGLNSANDGGKVINQTFEGLMASDAKGATPAAAESYTLSADKKTYTFKIRSGAKWSDGKPLRAQDFEYAWKRVLDPKTAAEYSFQMFYVKNAQRFFKGEAKMEDVGVKAIDDKTLRVELEAPTPYFLDLTSFYTFMPVRQDMVEKDPENWTKNAATSVSNGPFKLKEYKLGDKIILEPNKYYWDAASVKLKEVDMLMIVDQSTSLTAYESGDLDINENIPPAEIPRLLAEDKTFTIAPYVGVYYYIFQMGMTK